MHAPAGPDSALNRCQEFCFSVEGKPLTAEAAKVDHLEGNSVDPTVNGCQLPVSKELAAINAALRART